MEDWSEKMNEPTKRKDKSVFLTKEHEEEMTGVQ